MSGSISPRYDVVLSFAGEDRPYASALADEVIRLGMTVYYDANEQVYGWGQNLFDHLTRVYRDEGKFCVMFVSQYYEARVWTNHERRAAQARALHDGEDYILPVRLDDTQIPGLLDTTAFMRMPPETPRSIALALHERLRSGAPTVMEAGRSDTTLRREPRVSIAHLPTTRAELFGRRAELDALDDALKRLEINVATVVAWGGAGKSALVNCWLKQSMVTSLTDVQAIFGWSFYSQGTENETSADAFVDAALRWFGDPDPRAGSSWDRGARLAEYVQRQRTLLILDGLEPLQYGFGQRFGRLRDDAVTSLLRELAIANPGLCLVSTRVPVTDLQGFSDSVLTIDLQPLKLVDGADVLRSLGVWGEADELEAASAEYGGHALALTLLGTLLMDSVRGDVRRRHEFAADEEATKGPHAERVLRYYERWLGDGVEVAILKMVGLFDRPAARSLIAELVQFEIDGLTSGVPSVGTPPWRAALARLRRARLLSPETSYEPDALDAHPLVREYFGERLREDAPEAWRVGHGRIFVFLENATPEYPVDLVMMASLYSAVVHGCKATAYRRAFEDVYWKRVLRGYEYFSTYEIAAFGSELAALGAFFKQRWNTLPDEIDPHQQGLLLSQVGYCLRAVGSLSEAIAPLRKSVDILERLGEWRDATVPSENLSRTLLPLGEIPQAIKEAKRALTFARRSGVVHLQVDKLSVLADALHKHGDIEAAGDFFARAEDLSGGRLTSFAGARYCDYLVSMGALEDARIRCQEEIETLGEGRKGYLLRGLYSLYLGRAAKDATPRESMGFITSAVDYFRRAGRQDYLPEALVSRARLGTVMGDFTRAEEDLAEAVLVSNRGEMKISLIDANLESAALYLARNQQESARSLLAEVRELVRATEYLRANPRLAELDKTARPSIDNQ